MLLERLRRRERRPVDALEHRVALVAAPVRAGHVRELHGLEEARGGHVRPLADVDPLVGRRAVLVEADLLVRRDRVDDLDLVGLAHRREHPLGLVAGDHHAPEGRVRVDDLEHGLLDLAQVVVGEAAAGLVEVVIEAVLDRGADGHLGARKEALHGVGHHVRGRVPDDGEPVGVGRADGRQLRRRRLDRRVQVDRAPAVATAMTSLSSLPAAERISRGVFRSGMGRGRSYSAGA